MSSMLYASGTPVELHLLLPVRGPLALARALILRTRRQWLRLRGKPVAQHYAPDVAAIVATLGGTGGHVIVHAIDRGDRALARATRRLQLDVLLPSFEPLPYGRGIRWVGYLYDFQHRYLAHLFAADECARRDAAMARMLDTASAVIVNAQAVAEDVRTFFPQAKARVFALPFAPVPNRSWFDLDVSGTQARYNIRGEYFIVCNQFWTHKNHAVAFDAFASIARENPQVSLVCTGATSDHRDPEFFGELMERATALGVRERLHILGLIPKLDQIALMRGALALVQPTLFEGGPGGGAVYDAIGVGQRCIVSDIPVNRELDEPGIVFFPPHDSAALARAMARMLAEPVGSTASADSLMALGRARRAAGGARLLEAIACARSR
ncbi:MAG: glycosyltransferase [Pseudomonadota bacterium]|nr:glycosyltransferase [Pseudomonadota bacterium]